MAEHKLSGKDILLFIDPLGGTEYDTIVCLTNQTWQGSTNVIDATSKCGPDSLPGTQSNSISFEGQNLFDPVNGYSGADLFVLWKNSTTIGWKIAPVSPTTGDETLEGTGFISELSKNYNQTDPSTFSGTLSIYGSTTQTISGAKTFTGGATSSSWNFSSTSSIYLTSGAVAIDISSARIATFDDSGGSSRLRLDGSDYGIQSNSSAIQIGYNGGTYLTISGTTSSGTVVATTSDCQKPGGGTWNATSDARLKENDIVGGYAQGTGVHVGCGSRKQ